MGRCPKLEFIDFCDKNDGKKFHAWISREIELASNENQSMVGWADRKSGYTVQIHVIDSVTQANLEFRENVSDEEGENHFRQLLAQAHPVSN